MGCQCIARKKCVYISCGNERGKGRPCITVKYYRRSQDPDDVPVIALVSQKIVEFVIINGKGGLPGNARTERKFFIIMRCKVEGPGMYIDAIFSILPPAARNQITFFYIAEFSYTQGLIGFQNHDAIHPGFFWELPLSFFHLVIFRINRCRMVIFRCHPVFWR